MLALSTFLPTQAVFAESAPSYCALVVANIYLADDTQSEIIGTLKQNEVVKIITEYDSWCLIEQDNIQGYVQRKVLYVYLQTSSITIKRMRVTATSVGRDVSLYSMPSSDADEMLSINDGTVLDVFDETNEFTRVLYRDQVYYINSKNITSGITYYQRLALLIALICVVAVVIVIILIFLAKRQHQSASPQIKL